MAMGNLEANETWSTSVHEGVSRTHTTTMALSTSRYALDAAEPDARRAPPRFVVAATPAMSRFVVVTGITAELARIFPGR